MAINIGGNTVKNKSDGGKVIYNGKECTEVWYKSSSTATAVKVWPENDGYAYLTQNHWPDLKSLGGNCINHNPVWVPALKTISESNPHSAYFTSANIPAKVPFTQKIFPVLNKSNAKLKYWTLTFPDGTTQRFDDTNEHTFTFSQAGDYIENSYWDTNPEPEEKKYYIDVICYPAASYTNKWTLTSGKEPVYEKDVTSVYSAKFPGCSAKRYKTELGMKMSVRAPILTDKVLTTMKSTTTWGSWPGPGSDSNWSDRGTSGFDVIISDNPNRAVDDYQGILYVVEDEPEKKISVYIDSVTNYFVDGVSHNEQKTYTYPATEKHKFVFHSYNSLPLRVRYTTKSGEETGFGSAEVVNITWRPDVSHGTWEISPQSSTSLTNYFGTYNSIKRIFVHGNYCDLYNY